MFLTKLATLLTLALTASATVDISPFISNGVEAEITEFPFLVSIQQINVHVCGASMLSETWILSSARCFAARPINELNIEYGKTIISPGPNGPNKAAISRVVIHEDFTTSQASFPNDISLAESATPMITGFHEPYAKLIVTGASQFQSGTRASHAGWGHIRPSTRTTVLQKAEIHILSQKECTDAAADSTGPNRKNICAIGDSVLCTADVGSPLIVNGVLVGVASFRNGPACDSVEGRFPNVYTDVSFFIDFIERVSGIGYQLNMFLQPKA